MCRDTFFNALLLTFLIYLQLTAVINKKEFPAKILMLFSIWSLKLVCRENCGRKSLLFSTHDLNK